MPCSPISEPTDKSYSLRAAQHPRLAVAGGGATGGTGSADRRLAARRENDFPGLPVRRVFPYFGLWDSIGSTLAQGYGGSPDRAQ
jgi:hypothetical protein